MFTAQIKKVEDQVATLTMQLEGMKNILKTMKDLLQSMNHPSRYHTLNNGDITGTESAPAPAQHPGESLSDLDALLTDTFQTAASTRHPGYQYRKLCKLKIPQIKSTQASKRKSGLPATHPQAKQVREDVTFASKYAASPTKYQFKANVDSCDEDSMPDLMERHDESSGEDTNGVADPKAPTPKRQGLTYQDNKHFHHRASPHHQHLHGIINHDKTGKTHQNPIEVYSSSDDDSSAMEQVD